VKAAQGSSIARHATAGRIESAVALPREYRDNLAGN